MTTASGQHQVSARHANLLYTFTNVLLSAKIVLYQLKLHKNGPAQVGQGVQGGTAKINLATITFCRSWPKYKFPRNER